MTQIFETEDFKVRYANEKDEYKTFDNAPILKDGGKDLPTLRKLTDEEGNVVVKDGVEQDDEKFGNIWDQVAKNPLQITEEYPMPKFGEQVVVVLFWGKYYTNTHAFMPRYSKLQAKYGSKLSILAVSVDGVEDWAKSWFAKDKYHGKYESKFAAVWDKDYTVKKVFMKFGQNKSGEPIDSNFQFCCGTLPVPTAFVFDKNKKCVWYQNHSNVVNDAATYMAVMEEQLDLIIEGKPVKSVFGDFEPESDDDSDDSDDESGDEGGVDMSDMAF